MRGDLLPRHDEKAVVACCQAPLDVEKVREAQPFRYGAHAVCGEAGPLGSTLQSRQRHHAREFRLRQCAAIREFDLMPGRGFPFAEPHHGRGHESVAELQFARIEAVNADELDLVEQIPLHRHPVIDIHELARDQPAG